MLSYRKLAMRVLGRPLNTGGGNDSPRPASQRAAAFILTAALLTGAAFPAFAGTYHIDEGDIVISAGTEAGTNKVEQGGTLKSENDTGTIITGESNKNTVTIDTSEGNVDVTFNDLKIDASSRVNPGATTANDAYYAAVNVTGKGDTTIELDGDNELKSGRNRAGLEHNQTADREGNVTSGKLTIQDDKGNAGSLTATGGQFAAGIGGASANAGQVIITGGTITAIGTDGAGIGGGQGNGSSAGNADIEISGGTIEATGGEQAAGIGGGTWGDANIKITGDAVIKSAVGGSSGVGNSTGGAGIGGGAGGHGTIDISGNAQVKNALGKDGGAGIGGGTWGDANIKITGDAVIKNATGGIFGAGIGGGGGRNGDVTISGNAKIENAQGGEAGAGIGGGYAGLGDVTIEGNTTVNATGGVGSAGIGGGYGAENDEDGNGNQITIKSNESGSPTVNAVGGGTDETEEIVIGGAGIGAGCESNADTDIVLEGKVTIVAKAGEGNAAIGANGIEQAFTGLAEGSSITRYDSEGNNITLPTDPVPAVPSSSGGGSADASVQESVFPGLVVTDKDGQRISYTSIRGNNVLSIRAGRFTASLRVSLATLRQLRAEGIDTITFQTILCSTTLSVDELLAMGGEDAEAVLTHRLTASSLTVG